MMTFLYSFLGSFAAMGVVAATLFFVLKDPAADPHHIDRS